MDDALINRLAGNAADIEMAADRLTALELAVSFLLYQLPDDAGLCFLSRQTNQFEEAGTSPGVVAELDILRGYVSALRELQAPSQRGQLE